MKYHCNRCDGELEFKERKYTKIGRHFICKCLSCGYTIKQYCKIYFVKGTVLSNERIIEGRTTH